MLKKLLIGMLVIVAGSVFFGLKLPAEFAAERNIRIDRSAATVFTLLNDFNRFPEWSPLQQRDADVVHDILVSAQGPGAKLAWQGDPRRVGSGTIEIVQSIPDRLIEMKIDLAEQGKAVSRFELQPEGEGTRVALSVGMDARNADSAFNGLLIRYFGLLFDSWLGADLEQGLVELKGLAESMPAADLTGSEVEIVEVRAVPIIYVSGQTSQDSDDVAAAISEAFAEISRFLDAHDVGRAGAPLAITRSWDENGFRFDAAVPVSGAIPVLSGRLESGMSPGGKAVRIIHRGPYEEILETYRQLAAYLSVRGLVEHGVSWEEYRTDPHSTTPAESVTAIYIQIRD